MFVLYRISQSLEVDFYENPSIPKASAADVRQRLESNKNRQIEKQTRKTIKKICLSQSAISNRDLSKAGTG